MLWITRTWCVALQLHLGVGASGREWDATPCPRLLENLWIQLPIVPKLSTGMPRGRFFTLQYPVL